MTIGIKLEQEAVPASKKYMISTRENSEYKWQTDPTIVGALEIPSDPYFRLDGEYKSRPVHGKQQEFDRALQVWESMDLRQEFQKAAEAGPKSTYVLLPGAAGVCDGHSRSDKNVIRSKVNRGGARYLIFMNWGRTIVRPVPCQGSLLFLWILQPKN
jgi:hypothetical protein